MLSLFNKSVFLAFILFLFQDKIHAQTHLRLILKTSLPIDSALIVHFTDKEVVRVGFKDTLDMDFTINGMDFYHINYMQKEKIYNERIYLDSGNITIIMRIENDKLFIDKVAGSPIFDTVRKWKKNYATLVQNKDTVAIDSFLLRTYEEQIENMFSFHIGLRYLDMHQNEKLKLYALLPLIAKQADELRKRFGFSFLNDRLQGIIRNNSIILSDFEFIDLENKPVHPNITNSDFVILDFWFVGCAPCMEDHKKIKKLLPLLKQKNTEFISIANDESYQKWKDYLEKNNYSWRQYKKPSTAENIITRSGISTYPTYILLNRTGGIIFSTYSLEEILRQLD